MTRRIFSTILITAILAVLLSSFLMAGTVYRAYDARMAAELRNKADAMVCALNLTDDDLSYLAALPQQDRITLIDADGRVLFDSTADAASLSNHSDRPEFVQALATGIGEHSRHSASLSDMTHYIARRTEDGHVLRIAYTRSSIADAFLDLVPQLMLMLLTVAGLSLIIARVSAKMIVAPVNNLNLDAPLQNDVYDELTPLLTRMDRQYTQIRTHLRDLERAQSEISAIIENMQEGIVMLDRENRLLAVNESAAALLNASRCREQELPFSAICHDQRVLELVENAQTGRSGDTLLSQNGHTYRCFASPVMSRKKIGGVVLLLLDVTARHAAEQLRREFSANVSHELKTPLTAISGFAEIIRDGIAQPEDIPAFAGKIHTEARRLVTLVNDIMNLSRLDEKQGLGSKESLSLMALLADLTEAFAPLAGDKGISLTLCGDDETIQGYPLLLRELFQNLLDNAVKYTPSGGHVTVSLRRVGGRIHCSVEDTGIGIPEEHLPHIFERFYRVDKSHSRQTGGTGLGLAIVRHTADVHGAQIQVQSQVGKGTCITVCF